MSNITNNLLYRDIQPEQKKFLVDALELAISFVEGKARENKPLNYLSNNELIKMIEEDLPLNGSSLNELLDVLKSKIVPFSIAQCDQAYLSFPDVGNSIAGYAADILSSFLNQNLIAVDRSAPIATFVEIQLILWLRELVGYDSYKLSELPNLAEIGGIWTSGGNMSNHIAVLTALQNRFPEVKEKGLISLKKRPGIILAKGVEHFSFAGAAQVLGLGKESLIWTKANNDFTSDVESVETTLENISDQIDPFMVVAVAGNCRTTSIDNIMALREICDKFGLWLHVDACHGGSLLFSDNQRSLIGGIEQSDSISLDPHKGLFVTYPSSYVLFKNPKSLNVFARYPQKILDSSCFDMGLITPFYGSRGFDSLKLWLMIKHMGRKGISTLVDERQQCFNRMVVYLQSMNLFIFFNESHFYRTAFVFCSQENYEYISQLKINKSNIAKLRNIIDKYTVSFCENLYKDGEVIFDLFSLEDLDDRLGLGVSRYNTIGMCIGHPWMDEMVIEKVGESIARIAKPLAIQMRLELENIEKTEPYSSQRVTESPASW